MKIRLVMRDDDYCKAFIKAIQKYNQDLYIESGKDFSVNEGTLIVTDYNIRHFDMKIVENNRGGVVFILSREVPDKLRSREVGPFFIFKYDGMEKIMASLNMAYSIWRGDEQIQKMGCKVVSVFSDSRGEKSTFISKLIARQSVYRLNLKVLIIPMAFISELPSGNIESGAFMKLVYCIDLKRKLSREALFYKDNYDVEYFRMPKGINPLTAFGEEKLQEILRFFSDNYFDLIIIDIGTSFTDVAMKLIEKSDYIVGIQSLTDETIFKEVAKLRADEVFKIDSEYGMDHATLSADDLINHIYERRFVQKVSDD